ncbi:uncharacterized protein MELLADRAFT_108540 [Melampsora larici-populina 98AG31]|uniref:Transmembrane protein n=1 Tax=Melampsora larici-populina (strain 98AG31 / pathotype 3-4-7) TaxID=747676 RepID=F4RTF0_MELLP|nr:uncharacterized protein MELLADRAFT_108540 [Melampsora larici-populina 98AG31]EGG04246.1 hypothetical protein MELLADRAFT_108540 [Melampsora larici-populina 98AG31]
MSFLNASTCTKTVRGLTVDYHKLSLTVIWLYLVAQIGYNLLNSDCNRTQVTLHRIPHWLGVSFSRMSKRIFEVFLVVCGLLNGALAVAEIGLTIKAFSILNERKKLVSSKLPGGKLFAKPILSVGIALIVVSLVALVASIFTSTIRFTQRSKKWVSLSFGVAAFVFLPVLIAGTVIGASWHAAVTARLPQTLVDQLVAASGISLYYHDYNAVIGLIVVGWVLFTGLVLASVLEKKEFAEAEKTQQVGEDELVCFALGSAHQTVVLTSKTLLE